MANSFYIIKQGEVQVTKGGTFLRLMQSGDSFGEQALFGNCVRGATVKANQNEVKILSLSREDIAAILGDQIQVNVLPHYKPSVDNLHKYAEVGLRKAPVAPRPDEDADPEDRAELRIQDLPVE